MYQTLHSDASFFSRLTDLDLEFAEQVHRAGCPFCGGPLHRGSYLRKPRGLPPTVDRELRRESFCCGQCRRRVTPFSLRFLGRRVYVSVVVVIMAMASGRDATRLLRRSSAQLSPLDRRTIGRWRRWWSEEVPRTPWFRRRQGELRGSAGTSDLPAALLERFSGDPSDRLLFLLRFLTPATSRSCPLAWC